MQILFRKQSYHVIGVTESWLKPYISNKAMELTGYKLIRHDRSHCGAGGVAFYIRKDFFKACRVKVVNKGSTPNLEHLILECYINSIRTAIGVGYICRRLLPLDELEAVLSECCLEFERVIFMGDLNVDMLKDESLELKNILQNLNLATPQTQPTRYHDTGASLLDLILSNIPFSLPDFKQGPGVSDHQLVSVNFDIPVRDEEKYFVYRDFNGVNYHLLQDDIENIDWSDFYSETGINKKVEILNRKILTSLEKHAPYIVKKSVPNKPPWLTTTIINTIQLRDIAHKVWTRDRSANNKNILKYYDKKVSGMIKSARKNYLRSKLDSQLSTKELWKNIREQGLCKNKYELDAPFDVDQLNQAFTALSFPAQSQTDTPASTRTATTGSYQNPQTRTSLNFLSNTRNFPAATFSFSQVDDNQTLTAIMNIKSGSIGSDEIPLKFLKMCTPAILPMITHLFNCIITSSIYPSCWKIGKVIAIPKISEPQSVQDMRPITILSTMSKALEVLLSDQIKDFINYNNLLSEFQSGFRKGHSTATLLLDVSDFVRQCIDRGSYVALVLLDFSKAFNSVNFELLRGKLLNEYGFAVDASDLMLSYMSDRSQYVEKGNDKSQCLPLASGVPQGSILGPIIFSLYINDICEAITHCKFHMFADDVQIMHEIKYNPVKELDVSGDQINLVNQDLCNINYWANRNSLSLNASKTKAIIFGRQEIQHILPPVKIINEIIPYENKVKNLGVIMTSNMDWKEHIALICQRMYLSLRSLWLCQNGTPKKTRIYLVRSLVLSHLLYCDIVFSNLSYALMSKVTRIFNACLRYVHGLRRYDHLSPFRNSIFGISLTSYLDFRLVLFMYKTLLLPDSPPYIKKTFHFSRSSRTKNLIISTHRSSIMEDALMVRGAIAWNRLPLSIRESVSVSQFKNDCMDYFANL